MSLMLMLLCCFQALTILEDDMQCNIINIYRMVPNKVISGVFCECLLIIVEYSISVLCLD